MLRLVLLIVLVVLVARAFWRVVDGVIEGLSGRPRSSSLRHGAQMERDPVCGTFVLPNRAISLDAGSRRVFFCSAACRDKYRARTA
jgi:YHS domain-containing protein